MYSSQKNLELKKSFFSFELDKDWKEKEIKILNDFDLQSLDIRVRFKKEKIIHK